MDRITRTPTSAHAAVYYDADVAASGGAVLAGNLTNITTLAGLTALSATDFSFI